MPPARNRRPPKKALSQEETRLIEQEKSRERKRKDHKAKAKREATAAQTDSSSDDSSKNEVDSLMAQAEATLAAGKKTLAAGRKKKTARKPAVKRNRKRAAPAPSPSLSPSPPRKKPPTRASQSPGTGSLISQKSMHGVKQDSDGEEEEDDEDAQQRLERKMKWHDKLMEDDPKIIFQFNLHKGKPEPKFKSNNIILTAPDDHDDLRSREFDIGLTYSRSDFQGVVSPAVKKCIEENSSFVLDDYGEGFYLYHRGKNLPVDYFHKFDPATMNCPMPFSISDTDEWLDAVMDSGFKVGNKEGTIVETIHLNLLVRVSESKASKSTNRARLSQHR
jgi:hypothetical protein